MTVLSVLCSPYSQSGEPTSKPRKCRITLIALGVILLAVGLAGFAGAIPQGKMIGGIGLPIGISLIVGSWIHKVQKLRSSSSKLQQGTSAKIIPTHDKKASYSDPSVFLEQANQLIKQDKNDEAFQLLQDNLFGKPVSEPLLIAIAQNYIKIGNKKRALEVASVILEDITSRNNILIQLCQMHFDSNEKVAVYEIIGKILKYYLKYEAFLNYTKDYNPIHNDSSHIKKVNAFVIDKAKQIFEDTSSGIAACFQQREHQNALVSIEKAVKKKEIMDEFIKL